MRIATLFSAYRKAQQLRHRLHHTAWLEEPYEQDLLTLYERRRHQAERIEAALEHRIELADRAARQREK